MALRVSCLFVVAALCADCSAFAADIVLTPPAAGGVSITNAAGNATRFRVGEDGIFTLPGVVAAPTPALGLCVEIATGRVGTCSLGGGGTVTSIAAGTGLAGGTITSSGSISIAASFQLPQTCSNGQVPHSNGAGVWTCVTAATGTVTSIATGSGLSGGPITSTGTISLSATNLLPSAPCAINQIPKWNGSAWVCAADVDTNSGGTVTSIATGTGLTGGPITTTGTIALGTVAVANGGTGQTTLPLNGVLYGQGTAAVATAVGTTGQLLAGTAGAPAWTNSPSISGNLTLAATSAIMKGGSSFVHNVGVNNTFVGVTAGTFITTGADNTALGTSALANDDVGSSNTAVGSGALLNNAGSNSTAVGQGALSQANGSSNIALGSNAGSSLTTGNNNIYIGNAGIAGDNGVTRVGSVQTKTFISGIRGITTGSANAIAVVIDSTGQLGTVSSSRRVKDDIADMDDATNALMKLRPVTFHYKAYGPGSPLQYGLIAEEVEEVYPDLVAKSPDGAIETVMYQYLSPMLLNHVQKQQRTIDRQSAEITEMKGQIAQMARLLEELHATR